MLTGGGQNIDSWTQNGTTSDGIFHCFQPSGHWYYVHNESGDGCMTAFGSPTIDIITGMDL